MSTASPPAPGRRVPRLRLRTGHAAVRPGPGNRRHHRHDGSDRALAPCSTTAVRADMTPLPGRNGRQPAGLLPAAAWRNHQQCTGTALPGLGASKATFAGMDTTGGAVVVWAPYQARLGRRVLVVEDLVDLRGPASGTLTLPLRLYWSPPGRVFNLDDPFTLRSVYQIVLGEAIRAGELTSYLNRDRLLAAWPDLYLPKGVQRAWEERHPQLRAAAAPAA